MELSLTKLLLLAFVILIVFGGGKLPNAMRDLGKGIRKFKEGINGDDDKLASKDSQRAIEEDSKKL